MTANEIVTAGVGTDGRTWVVLSDGSLWEYRFDEGWGWERVHRGLPGVAWQPTTTDASEKQRAMAAVLGAAAFGEVAP